MQLHENSDGASIMTFSNDQFADNRFIISADPSITAGTNAVMNLAWGSASNPAAMSSIMTLDGATNNVVVNPTNIAEQFGNWEYSMTLM